MRQPFPYPVDYWGAKRSWFFFPLATVYTRCKQYCLERSLVLCENDLHYSVAVRQFQQNEKHTVLLHILMQQSGKGCTRNLTSFSEVNFLQNETLKGTVTSVSNWLYSKEERCSGVSWNWFRKSLIRTIKLQKGHKLEIACSVRTSTSESVSLMWMLKLNELTNSVCFPVEVEVCGFWMHENGCYNNRE